MTDNELIKALECCGVVQSCKGCPYNGAELHPKMYCQDKKDMDARDLINRQKAEIKRLADTLKHYLYTNEENGVVFIPKFVVKKRLRELTEKGGASE